MQNFNDLSKYAIILIYPNGESEYELLDYRLLHMEYFIDLNKKSTILKELVKDNNINLSDNIDDVEDAFTYDIDTSLAKLGVIILHNLSIYELQINANSDFEYYVSLPKELTDTQKNILNNLNDKYDLSGFFYTQLDGDYLEDITYEEFEKILINKTK